MAAFDLRYPSSIHADLTVLVDELRYGMDDLRHTSYWFEDRVLLILDLLFIWDCGFQFEIMYYWYGNGARFPFQVLKKENQM